MSKTADEIMGLAADGGPAFPVQDRTNEWGYAIQPGMSLRDWFAGQALAGLMANGSGATFKADAEAAYVAADAMLAARSAKK